MKHTASPECTALPFSGLGGRSVRLSGRAAPGLGLAGWSARCSSEACVVVYASLVVANLKNDQKQQKQIPWTFFWPTWSESLDGEGQESIF